MSAVEELRALLDAARNVADRFDEFAFRAGLRALMIQDAIDRHVKGEISRSEADEQIAQAHAAGRADAEAMTALRAEFIALKARTDHLDAGGAR